MHSTRISLIAAMGKETRAIGKHNELLWRIPEDLRRFKALTLGHPVIMGSKTYASIGKPLPGRANIVVSDDPTYALDGVRVCNSIERAVAAAKELDDSEIFIIGGGSVYAQTIDLADRLYLTVVDSDVEGDVAFPEYASLPFREVEHSTHTHDGISYAFITMDRIEKKNVS